MLKFRFTYLMLVSLLGLTACSGEDDRSTGSPEPTPEPRTRVVFSPGTAELPVPSDIQFASQDPIDGTMSAGNDPTNPVVSGIDALDGNSVLAPFDIKFDGALDDTQTLDANSFIAVEGGVIPNPAQNVFLLPLVFPSGDALNQAKINGSSVEVPTFSLAAQYAAAAAAGDVATLAALAQPTVRAELISLDGGTNNVLRINPLRPLQPKTKYLVVLTDISDATGEPVLPSAPYEILSDPTQGSPIRSLGNSVKAWENLAAGYFGFKQTVYTQGSLPFAAPSVDDIIFSMTFTTGGTTDVLQAVAAPETFFEASLTTQYKKDAIIKLVSGAYSVQGTVTTADPSDTDTAIAATMNGLLTSADSPLYNAAIAGAIGAGAEYATIAASGASAVHIMQRAAAEAAVAANNAGAVAQGTVSAIVQGIATSIGQEMLPTSAVFPVPAARATSFYRSDSLPAISPAFSAPSILHQGQITLPYYQGAPAATDGSPLVTSKWDANETIGMAVDPTGATPATSKVTYRYPFPTKKADVTIPLIVVTPDTTTYAGVGLSKPANGWPVIIFVHGITGDRSTALPMANALANACIAVDAGGNPTGLKPGVPCYATIAIDQPLHGVAPAAGVISPDLPPLEGSIVPALRSVSDPDFTIVPNVGDNSPAADLTERHFDFTAPASPGAPPIAMDYDAETGSSGSLFINLTNFENARDNLRQMTVDLLNLNASLANIDLDDDAETTDLDVANVYFIGHSLGAINGLPFVAINNSAAVQNSAFSDLPRVKAAVGLKTGGGIPRLLTNSNNFAPTILGGLAQASSELQQGRSGLETYLNVFQGVLDSTDVMNFAAMLSDANSATGILLTEVIGDEVAENPADQTIPNSADEYWPHGSPLVMTVPTTGFVIDQFPAPLAGTEPLIAQFGAIPTASVSAESDGDAEVIVTRFTDGNHRTPISADPPPVFFEMVSEIVGFFVRDGVVTESLITNTDVVETIE